MSNDLIAALIADWERGTIRASVVDNAMPAIVEMMAENERLRSRFTSLDKPRHSGDTMLDQVLAKDNPEFRAWVESLPATYWARYDLSAARIGWEAATERLRAELAECKKDAERYRFMRSRASIRRYFGEWMVNIGTGWIPAISGDCPDAVCDASVEDAMQKENTNG